MAMSPGSGGGGLTNDINVTPMIDVLLVLLIIFMMVVPMARKAIDIQLPDPNPAVAPANAVSQQIVLEVLPNGVYQINKQEPLTKDNLMGRLKELYDPRPEKLIFIKGDPAVKYQDVIFAMDMARQAGVKVIGVPPKDKSAPSEVSGKPAQPGERIRYGGRTLLGASAVLISPVMYPPMNEPLAESKPRRPRYRPPIGIPIREEGKTTGALVSIALHALILLLLLAPPFLLAREMQVRNEGAGGPGPAGGGGGGSRGTGGDQKVQERVRFIQVAPAPAPAVVTPKVEPKPVPVVPKVEPPKPKPPEPVTPAPEIKPEPAPAGECGSKQGCWCGRRHWQRWHRGQRLWKRRRHRFRDRYRERIRQRSGHRRGRRADLPAYGHRADDPSDSRSLEGSALHARGYLRCRHARKRDAAGVQSVQGRRLQQAYSRDAVGDPLPARCSRRWPAGSRHRADLCRRAVAR